MNSKIAKRVLWVDLEMTGLSPTEDPIMEVAAIITDWDFNELATYQGVVKSKVSVLKKRMQLNAPFWDANPESRQGLLEQNKSGKSLVKIEGELIDLIDTHFDTGSPVLLAGNTIHNDRRFIMAQWPKLDQRLFYRMLDVSAWKVVFEGKYKKKFPKPENHRALDDIRGSIAELKYYLGKLK